MLLKDIKEWFKINHDISLFEQVSINTIDNNLNKAICFYNSKRTIAPINKLRKSTYSVKPLTILIRYGKNQDEAEQRIKELYNFFDNKIEIINNKRVKFVHCYENPINLGLDGDGIQEYSLEINLYYEREVK